MPRHLLMPVRHVSESSRCQLSNGASPILLASVPAELQAAMEMVFTGEFLLNLKTDISTPSHLLAPVRYVLESPRCQLSNGGSHVLLASVPAELHAALEMVFTGKFLLTLMTDISTPTNLLTPIRHLSNGGSHGLLASVPTELQAVMELVFTDEFLLNLKTDSSMPSYSLAPVRYVLESPRCQLSNGASHVLLASVPAELQAAMEMVFTGEFLLNLKTDSSTPSHSLTPVRHLSNGGSHGLLASVPTELQAVMELVFTDKFLLNLKTDSSTPSHSLAPVRYVLESPRCQLSNGVSHGLLASVPAELQAVMELVFTGKFLLNLKTDSSTPSHSLAPVRHVPESPRCQLSNGGFHVLLASVPAELQAAMEMVFTGEFLLTLKTDISTPSHSLAPIRHVPESP
ncbi:hypothetical protein L873DRAFT_1818568 [Choiromyces venosus 120613-1]|uniref:Uncharacterized protein n=1 Tax=Choiromyces venosus 120613-1 TaxID=1336337 RepID=A0A3N4J681_9PEZI|nr:hypothetical protein L873DRAFT_1818568 [Choiromyces venosus 120613-1]